MNFATSSGADPVTTNTFQQAAGADTFFSVPASRWTSCRSHNHIRTFRSCDALHAARDVTKPFMLNRFLRTRPHRYSRAGGNPACCNTWVAAFAGMTVIAQSVRTWDDPAVMWMGRSASR